MGLTAKEFADKHAISSRKIKPWYEKGYLGSTTKDEKTGVYDIPEDTPVPYSADGRIKKIPKLWGNYSMLRKAKIPFFRECTLT